MNRTHHNHQRHRIPKGDLQPIRTLLFPHGITDSEGFPRRCVFRIFIPDEHGCKSVVVEEVCETEDQLGDIGEEDVEGCLGAGDGGSDAF